MYNFYSFFNSLEYFAIKYVLLFNNNYLYSINNMTRNDKTIGSRFCCKYSEYDILLIIAFCA